MGMRMYPDCPNVAALEFVAGVPRGTTELLKQLETMPLEALKALFQRSVIEATIKSWISGGAWELNRETRRAARRTVREAIQKDRESGYPPSWGHFLWMVKHFVFPFAERVDGFTWGKNYDYNYLLWLENMNLEPKSWMDFNHGLGEVRDREHIVRIFQLSDIRFDRARLEAIDRLTFS